MNEDEFPAVVKKYELVESGFMAEFPYAIVKSIRDPEWLELLKFLPEEWLCGYIGVPESHPWFNQTKDEITNDIDISYKDYRPEYPIQTTVPICWVGFDTAHYGFIQENTVMDVDVARQIVEHMAAAASEYYRKEPDGTATDTVDDIVPPRGPEGDDEGG